jgi:hypothetical protein
MRRRPVRSLLLVLLAGVVVRASQVGALADAGRHGPATARERRGGHARRAGRPLGRCAQSANRERPQLEAANPLWAVPWCVA